MGNNDHEGRAPDAAVIGRPDIEIGYRRIASDAEAAALPFAGSPTILVDGVDAFDKAVQVTELACRVYPTAGGLAGLPTIDQLAGALRAKNARVIAEAGAIHGKSGRGSTVSDWMDMEKARAISITSTALQFPHTAPDGTDCVINPLGTAGHADFSEDTYLVLTAVDAAVMLIGAAKGLEPQTLKQFQVCRHRGIPIITVIDKEDRPG